MSLDLLLGAEAAEPANFTLKEIITFASIALTAILLALTLWKGLRRSRLRPLLDTARIVVQVAAAIAVPMITAVVTPPMLLVGALLVGLALGVGQGMFVKVDVDGDHIFASRSVLGFVIWAGGLVLMQGAGVVNRAGLVEIGQAVTWLSIGIGLGLVLGRHVNVDRAIKAANIGAVTGLLAVTALITLSATDAPPAEAQGCPAGYEQGYWDEVTQSQVNTSNDEQCSIWVNGRSATYSIYRLGCDLGAEWTALSGQSTSEPIYGRNAGLGFVLYPNAIIRVSTFPQSNDFDLEPAAAVYARFVGPSCPSAPAPAAPAPTAAPPPAATPAPAPTAPGTGNQGNGNQGTGNQGTGNQGNGNGSGSTTAPPAQSAPTPTPRIVTEQIDPNAVPESAPIEDEGGSLFPTAVPEPTAASAEQNDQTTVPTTIPVTEPTTIGDATPVPQIETTESAASQPPGTEPDPDGVAPPPEAQGPDGDARQIVSDSQDVTEDEALASAVSGLLAAAAAGVITLSEAAAGIREALDGAGREHVDEQDVIDDVAEATGIDFSGGSTGEPGDPANQARGPDGDPLGPNGADISRARQAAQGPESELDQEWRAARARGQALVDELEAVRQRLDGASATERAALMEQARQLAIDINADYSARSIMKPQGRSPLAEFFDQTLLAPIYQDVDGRTLDRLNEMGLRRGGQRFGDGDMWDVRNEASAGTVGMDRDVALREAKGEQAALLGEMERAQAEMAASAPGSPEHRAAQESLERNRQAYQQSLDGSRLSVDPDQLRAGALAELESLPPGSARRAELEDLVRLADRLDGKRPPGTGGEVRLSPTDWNQIAQTVYDGEYERVTGRSSAGSYQAVTTGANPEAYADTNALRSDRAANPLAPEHASQTASVGGVKDAHNQHLVDGGHITRGEALQETARGTAKDMITKVIPQLRLDPNVSPERIAEFERIQDVMARAGRGEIPPSGITDALIVATGDRNITLDRVLDRVEANFETSIARGTIDPTRPTTATTVDRIRNDVTSGINRVRTARPADVFGAVGDAATVNQRVQENLASGMSGVEATTVAIGQTAGGNAMSGALVQSGMADPRTLMTGGALLPAPMQDILPDQMVENTIGTGYGLGTAAAQSLADSIQNQTIDTEAFDQFATDLASGNQRHVDPLTAVAVLSDLAGEESARLDGENLLNDLERIVDTGVGGEMMQDFQQSVDRGEHGAILDGLDDVTRIGSDLLVDPSTTVGDFFTDLSTIAEHGVGDGYWTEAGQHAANVARDVPLVGTVISGYDEIAAGVEESGFVGFGTEMAEGASALGSEMADSLSESASNAADYLRSWF